MNVNLIISTSVRTIPLSLIMPQSNLVQMMHSMDPDNDINITIDVVACSEPTMNILVSMINDLEKGAEFKSLGSIADPLEMLNVALFLQIDSISELMCENLACDSKNYDKITDDKSRLLYLVNRHNNMEKPCRVGDVDDIMRIIDHPEHKYKAWHFEVTYEDSCLTVQSSKFPKLVCSGGLVLPNGIFGTSEGGTNIAVFKRFGIGYSNDLYDFSDVEVGHYISKNTIVINNLRFTSFVLSIKDSRFMVTYTTDSWSKLEGLPGIEACVRNLYLTHNKNQKPLYPEHICLGSLSCAWRSLTKIVISDTYLSCYKSSGHIGNILVESDVPMYLGKDIPAFHIYKYKNLIIFEFANVKGLTVNAGKTLKCFEESEYIKTYAYDTNSNSWKF